MFIEHPWNELTYWLCPQMSKQIILFFIVSVWATFEEKNGNCIFNKKFAVIFVLLVQKQLPSCIFSLFPRHVVAAATRKISEENWIAHQKLIAASSSKCNSCLPFLLFPLHLSLILFNIFKLYFKFAKNGHFTH